MSENNPRDLIPSSGGFFQDLTRRVKLILRLMGDRRVNPVLKIIPLSTIVYFFFFPDIAPGPVDDAAILWLGMYLFVELCPPEVVEEHTANLSHSNIPASWADPSGSKKKSNPSDEGDVVDSEFREI
jgi:hypothetical protein